MPLSLAVSEPIVVVPDPYEPLGDAVFTFADFEHAAAPCPSTAARPIPPQILEVRKRSPRDGSEVSTRETRLQLFPLG